VGSIPFSAKPLVYEDKETGVWYFLKPPCGETESAMFELLDTLPPDPKKRKQAMQNRAEMRRFDDATIDIILSSWESEKVKLPEFPKDGKPSRMMRWDLKISILSFYNSQKNFTGDDIKK
jgi:hypothetical protein